METWGPSIYGRGVWPILRKTFGLYASHFLVFVGIVSAVQLPVIGALFLAIGSANTMGTWPLPYPVIVLSTGFLATTPVTYAVSVAQAGSKPGVIRSLRAASPLSLPLLGAFIVWAMILTFSAAAAIGAWLAGLAILVASAIQGMAGSKPLVMGAAFSMFFLAAAVSVYAAFLFVRMILTPSVVAMENRGYLYALRRSWRLVALRPQIVYGTAAIIMLLVIAAQTCLLAPVRSALGVTGLSAATFGDPHPKTLAVMGLGMLITMILWPLPAIATALMYFDFSSRKDAFSDEDSLTDDADPETD